MKKRGSNAFIFLADEILCSLQKSLGIFGPFSVKLVFGLVLGFASLALFANLSEDLLFNELVMFDKIATGIVRFYVSEEVTGVMTFITGLGSAVVLAVVGLLAMLYTGAAKKHLWDTVLIPVSLIGGILLNEGLKFLFHRQRPGLPHLVEVTGLSFPSGHAMMSFIFYGMLIYLVWVNVTHQLLRNAVSIICILFIIAVGISRIYLGVHYPSDVLAGFAAGSFWLTACILGLRGLRYQKAENPNTFIS